MRRPCPARPTPYAQYPLPLRDHASAFQHVALGRDDILVQFYHANGMASGQSAEMRMATEKKTAPVVKGQHRCSVEDLQFLAGDQWPEYAKAARKDAPMLTINRLPQFCQRVTGGIELSRPAIKVKPTGNGATEEVAEILRGMIRYIENRSIAKTAYCIASPACIRRSSAARLTKT